MDQAAYHLSEWWEEQYQSSGSGQEWVSTILKEGNSGSFAFAIPVTAASINRIDFIPPEGYQLVGSWHSHPYPSIPGFSPRDLKASLLRPDYTFYLRDDRGYLLKAINGRVYNDVYKNPCFKWHRSYDKIFHK